ncbi:hypothetical protein HFN89_03660 [Rhizobium laguerreae]|nr:hypothetical protein [Rhizobium laguerreae]
MTALFVNHEDIRQFVSRLAIEQPEDRSPTACLEHVARCFGLPYPEFSYRCRADRPHSDVGLPLETRTVSALAKTLVENDFTCLKNTRRLELVAAAFGWKADAFMHHLKSTTASLGRNPTLANTFGAVQNPTLDALGGGSKMEAWKKAITRAAYGLYIVVGPTGSGKSTTLQRSALHLAEHLKVTAVEHDVPPDGTEEGDRFQSAILWGVKGGTTAFVLREIRSRRDARFALWLAERAVVLTTMHADSPLQAINRVSEFSTAVPVGPLMGVFSQDLLRSADHEAGSGRTMIADFASYEWDGARNALSELPWETRRDGLYADAITRIANGETTLENVAHVFGESFRGYVARSPMPQVAPLA